MNVVIAVVLTLFIISIYSLYKLKNYISFLVVILVPILLVFVRNQGVCLADRMSEPCTWAYVLYVPAFLAGVVIYLLTSIYQGWAKYVRHI